MHQSPADVMKFSQSIDPQSLAASSTTNGSSVDMQGWEGVLFVLQLGATDGTTDMKAQDSADDTTFADISGAALTQIAGTGDNKIYLLDVWRPSARYVRPVVTTGAGAAADFEAVLALQYRRSGNSPITQHADVGELVKKAVN